MNHPIQQIVRLHKASEPVGVYSVCSANRYVLEAAMLQAMKDAAFLLIEATSNQVDQYGGYTGMTPAQFVDYVTAVAAALQFPAKRIVFGGDHLGPNVWQGEKAEAAMAKARVQIRDYVNAGFSKIHLDTSMRCAGDPGDAHTPLDPRTVAARAADLCEIAEKTFSANKNLTVSPVYVIGTEVPIPGGAQEALSDLQPSTMADTAHTIAVTQQAFYDRGLEDAWQRVIAVVVQPGVEFGDATVVHYNRRKTRDLTSFIEKFDHLVYEAHSTDYQHVDALRKLVEDHFAILKVGPWLTFAFREAVFGLADIEREWLSGRQNVELSSIKSVIEKAMTDNPRYWQKHYHGSESELAFARKFSYSDRIRYYWPDPNVRRSLALLISNLNNHPAPLTLLSQYLPVQHQAIRDGELTNSPIDIIRHKIAQVIEIYAFATRASQLESV